MRFLAIAVAALLFRASSFDSRLPALTQDKQEGAAQAALKKLAERFKDARTLSAKVVQTRKTSILDKPIVSSGTLIYRREPSKLVFRMTEPRTTEIHLDKAAYQVYRPDEKRLERFEFENDTVTGRLLMVFQPKTDEIGKAFAVRAGEAAKGEVEILLEPSDEKVRARLRKLALTVDEATGSLKKIAYTDPDGDEVRFDLSDVKINPELDPSAFDLKVPEGTRVLKHAAKLEK